jgi:hypothetical protein
MRRSAFGGIITFNRASTMSHLVWCCTVVLLLLLLLLLDAPSSADAQDAQPPWECTDLHAASVFTLRKETASRITGDSILASVDAGADQTVELLAVANSLVRGKEFSTFAGRTLIVASYDLDLAAAYELLLASREGR